MGWEKRHKSRYYYRKRREGKKVVSRYVGKGETANNAALMDDVDRDAKAKLKEDTKKNLQEDKLLQEEICKFSAFADGVVGTVLLLSGFHKRKGEWRKRRHGIR